MTSPYVELHCHSNYSFLEGASHPEELVARARDLEMPALAITDRNGLYGAVKFFGAAQRAGIKPIIGTVLTIDDGTTPPKDRVDFDRWGDRLLLLAEDKIGYTNLCRLISMAQMPNAKLMARLPADDLVGHSGHLIALVADPKDRLPFYQEVFGRDRVFLELHDHLGQADRGRNQALLDLSTQYGAPLVITNEVFYATRDRHRLHDVITAIRHRATLDEAQRYLHGNTEHALKSGRELRQVFSRYPATVVEEGMRNAAEIAGRCNFSLDLVSARFPGFPVNTGETPFSVLYRLCQEAVREKYRPVTPEVAARLQKELDVINKTGFSEFFLINWDLMRFARSRGIPGQGRGSAADSIVAYLLGITRVDPIEHNLLFERFLHEEMTTTPDIDIDFSSEHREQVIQYIYEKYGPERTGMVCNVVTYRQRSAIREVGKALGFKEDTIDHLAKSASAWDPESAETIAQAAGYAKAAPGQPWQQLFDLSTQIIGFPRHLSIHVGGMLVTGEPLIDIVPVERATMPGRMVVQFNKDDVEELGLIKMDMLGLRMLSVIAEALDLIEADTGTRPDLDALDLKDREVYELCQQADTIGVFQIESRAQMQTLPRSRPETFNDLVVEVAIIRPGPIQGDAVHPYLRRKQGKEPVTYLHPRLAPILEETLGVVLYQEQILKISMDCAGFSSAEADRFRRAMSSHRSHELMEAIRARFLQGCLQNEIPHGVAEEIFTKLAAFAEFGFTKSHAAAFARTCYETAWLKLHHAPALYAGLLNNQPMGFYHPHVIVEDAKHHGVTILPVDINRSYVRCSVEHGALRLGFNYVHGVGDKALEAIEEAQMKGAVTSLEDFCRRVRLTSTSRNGLTRAQVQNLILAGAFDALDPNRRQLVWRFTEQADDWQHSPMIAEPSEDVSLPLMTHRQRVATDYRMLSLSTTDHVIHFYRPQFTQMRVIDSKTLRQSIRDGARVRVGGLVITRQSPSTGKQFKFFTLADEFGHVDVILRPPIYQRYRQVANLEPILIMDGTLQKQDGVQSVLVDHIEAAPSLPDEDVFPTSRNYR
ncbi:MAG TPA: error-prone DNA polymerase [Candidatus Dormibacteraeota bacterium]